MTSSSWPHLRSRQSREVGCEVELYALPRPGQRDPPEEQDYQDGEREQRREVYHLECN